MLGVDPGVGPVTYKIGRHDKDPQTVAADIRVFSDTAWPLGAYDASEQSCSSSISKAQTLKEFEISSADVEGSLQVNNRRPFMWFFVVTTCSARPVALKKHQRQIDFGYSIELKNNESWISSDVAFSKQFALVSLLLSLYMFFRFASGGTVFQACVRLAAGLEVLGTVLNLVYLYSLGTSGKPFLPLLFCSIALDFASHSLLTSVAFGLVCDFSPDPLDDFPERGVPRDESARGGNVFWALLCAVLWFFMMAACEPWETTGALVYLERFHVHKPFNIAALIALIAWGVSSLMFVLRDPTPDFACQDWLTITLTLLGRHALRIGCWARISIHLLPFAGSICRLVLALFTYVSFMRSLESGSVASCVKDVLLFGFFRPWVMGVTRLAFRSTSSKKSSRRGGKSAVNDVGTASSAVTRGMCSLGFVRCLMGLSLLLLLTLQFSGLGLKLWVGATNEDVGLDPNLRHALAALIHSEVKLATESAWLKYAEKRLPEPAGPHKTSELRTPQDGALVSREELQAAPNKVDILTERADVPVRVDVDVPVRVKELLEHLDTDVTLTDQALMNKGYGMSRLLLHAMLQRVELRTREILCGSTASADCSRYSRAKPPNVLILFPNSFMGQTLYKKDTEFSPCPVRCTFHRDVHRSSESEGVVFHLVGGGLLPQRGSPKQRWAGMQIEPDSHSGKLRDPGVLKQLNATMSAIPGGHNPQARKNGVKTHLFTPLWSDYYFDDPIFWRPMASPWTVARKPHLVWLQNGCSEVTRRNEYVTAIQKYMEVDSYGGCLNNKKDPRSMRDPVGLLKEYMFYLCLEPYELYLSDKLYRGFQAGAIPVFLGHPEVGDFIPHPDAVIHVSDFDSPKALASYLKSVAQSPDLWFKHTKWRNSPGEITEKFVRAARFQYIHSQCRVCVWAHTGQDPLMGDAWDSPLDEDDVSSDAGLDDRAHWSKVTPKYSWSQAKRPAKTAAPDAPIVECWEEVKGVSASGYVPGYGWPSTNLENSKMACLKLGDRCGAVSGVPVGEVMFYHLMGKSHEVPGDARNILYRRKQCSFASQIPASEMLPVSEPAPQKVRGSKGKQPVKR